MADLPQLLVQGLQRMWVWKRLWALDRWALMLLLQVQVDPQGKAMLR